MFIQMWQEGVSDERTLLLSVKQYSQAITIAVIANTMHCDLECINNVNTEWHLLGCYAVGSFNKQYFGGRYRFHHQSVKNRIPRSNVSSN
jgi:hypothetical protein